MNPFEFITANKVICEVGAAHKLAQYCQELEISRLMLVTDSGIVQTGMADPLVAEIERAKQMGVSNLVMRRAFMCRVVGTT